MNNQPSNQDRVRQMADQEPLVGALLSFPAWISDQLEQMTSISEKSKTRKLTRNTGQKFLATLGLLSCLLSASNYSISLQSQMAIEQRISLFPTGRQDVEWRPDVIVPPVLWLLSKPVNLTVDLIRTGSGNRWVTDPRGLVPYWQPAPRLTFWSSIHGAVFLMGLTASLTLTLAQGLFLRSSGRHAKKIAAFNSASKRKTVVSPEDAIAIAAVKANAVNAHGLGRLFALSALGVAGGVVEWKVGSAVLITSTFSPAIKNILNIVSTFGSETFWVLSQPDDE
jgi:hypothetical protein